jgi:hypothetical protein
MMENRIEFGLALWARCLPLTQAGNQATGIPWCLEVGLKNSRDGYLLRSVQSFPGRDKRGCDKHPEA